LFELATWHGLAKLRLHTETTVQDLENSTARLGDAFRHFEKTVCPEYNTYDLPTEEAARSRRRTRKASAPPPTHAYADSGPEEDEQRQKKGKKIVKRKTRQLNLNSYKLHSLGGYAKAIRQFGTTDNYNSQTVCVFYEYYLLLTICNSRVNLSIDEGNGATGVLTRENILLVLEGKCDVSVTSIERKLYVKNKPFRKKSRLRIHSQLYRSMWTKGSLLHLQISIITSHWIHAQRSFFLSG
jgi:hypothetical protein